MIRSFWKRSGKELKGALRSGKSYWMDVLYTLTIRIYAYCMVSQKLTKTLMLFVTPLMAPSSPQDLTISASPFGKNVKTASQSTELNASSVGRPRVVSWATLKMFLTFAGLLTLVFSSLQEWTSEFSFGMFKKSTMLRY